MQLDKCERVWSTARNAWSVSGNTPKVREVDVLSSPSPTPSPQVPRFTMLLCYLITRMPGHLDTIYSLQQVLSRRNRSFPSLHRCLRPSMIPFSPTSCARYSALGCSFTRTKNLFRQSGEKNFQDKQRRPIQPRPRLVTRLILMRSLPTRARQNVQMLRRRYTQKRATMHCWSNGTGPPTQM